MSDKNNEGGKTDSNSGSQLDIIMEDFTPELKQQILERDGYKCVICIKGTLCGTRRNNSVQVQVVAAFPLR